MADVPWSPASRDIVDAACPHYLCWVGVAQETRAVRLPCRCLPPVGRSGKGNNGSSAMTRHGLVRTRANPPETSGRLPARSPRPSGSPQLDSSEPTRVHWDRGRALKKCGVNGFLKSGGVECAATASPFPSLRSSLLCNRVQSSQFILSHGSHSWTVQPSCEHAFALLPSTVGDTCPRQPGASRARHIMILISGRWTQT